MVIVLGKTLGINEFAYQCNLLLTDVSISRYNVDNVGFTSDSDVIHRQCLNEYSPLQLASAASPPTYNKCYVATEKMKIYGLI